MLIDFYATYDVSYCWLYVMYIRQAGPLKRREACDNLSPYSLSRRDWVR